MPVQTHPDSVLTPVQGEIMDVPIPEECHAEQAADYGGIGVSWGLNYKKHSAAACCRACKEHAEQNPSSQPCNVWVWCGEDIPSCRHQLLPTQLLHE